VQRLVKKIISPQNRFFLTVPAAGEEPEIKTDKTDLNKRKKLREGL
jgi:hypothetical protein